MLNATKSLRILLFKLAKISQGQVKILEIITHLLDKNIIYILLFLKVL